MKLVYIAFRWYLTLFDLLTSALAWSSWFTTVKKSFWLEAMIAVHPFWKKKVNGKCSVEKFCHAHYNILKLNNE